MITKYLCVLALFSLTMYTYSKRMVKNLRGQRVCVCVCSSFITLPSSRSDNNFVLCDHTKRAMLFGYFCMDEYEMRNQ